MTASPLTLLPADPKLVFEMPDYFVWCPSVAQDPATGRWHLFFSRWPRHLGFEAWATHSEVCFATADAPLGPYTFAAVVLPARGGDHWDARVTHNPLVRRFGDGWYLYYTGNHGPARGGVPATKEAWWTHRNNQRIGLAVAPRPEGPWRRFDHPLVDVNPASWDALITSNPAICEADEGYLLVYKTVSAGPMPFGGKVLHAVARASSPLGPFVRDPEPTLTHPTAMFPAEDPCLWRDPAGGYRMIAKDMQGYFTQAGMSLALFESADGTHWTPAAQPLVSRREIRWSDGRIEPVQYLERPHVLIDEGRPLALFVASMPGSRIVPIPIGPAPGSTLT